MIYEIRMTPEAKSDLRGIFEYIAFDLQSVQNAAGQLNRLEKSIASDGIYPKSGLYLHTLS